MRRLHGPARRRCRSTRAWCRSARSTAPTVAHGRGLAPGRRGRPRPAPDGVPRDRRRPVRHLHARDADGRPRLPRRRRRPRRGGDPRGDRRQPVPLHRLHQDRRGDRPRVGRRHHGFTDQEALHELRPDRIAVPTNGKRPHPVAPAAVVPDGTAPPAVDAGHAAGRRRSPGGLSPQQLAVGFGIVAWLLVIAAGLRSPARPRADRRCRSSHPSRARATSPRRTRSWPPAPARPIAGGTDLMVALTGELGEPPERVVDLWRLDELRGIARRWRRDQPSAR